MNDNKRVVITGIGPISSIGIGRQAFWEGILKAKTNIKLEKIFIDGELWDSFYFHKVDNFDISKFGIDKQALDWIRDWKEGDEITDLYYLIAAVKLALDDSGLENDLQDNKDIGLIVTHENLSLIPFLSKVSEHSFDMLTNKSKQITRKQYYEKIYRDCLKSGYDVQPFMTLFHVAKVFNIHNLSLFICNACASGVYAIEIARQMIKSNQNSIVIVSASDYPDIYKYLWFRDLGIYSNDGIIRPFCKDSNGLTFGDGGVALIIEELEHAKKRNAPIYAEYLGGGFSLEGWQVTVPQVGSSSYQGTILKALEQSKIDKEDIDLLCPHGVGSRIIDYYEAKAITDVFGLNPDRPLITTLKPYVGHNLGASALLETAILLLSLKNNVVLPTLNCQNPSPEFNISLVKKKIETEFKIVMKICCAFAGYNAAAVFKRLD